MKAFGIGPARVALMLCLGAFPHPAHAAGGPPVTPCESLVRLTFEGNTSITSAGLVTNGGVTIPPPANQNITGLPEFCRVVGVSRPAPDSNINFEVWLPTKTWNGKFMSVGEGGFAGTIRYTNLGLDGALDEDLKRGYVTASTDTGHLASDDAWAIGHPERSVDFGYRAKHLVTVAAKGLISALYGRPADYSYMDSCSTGGRQGLEELQRYPGDFDGFVVGSPIAFKSNLYSYRAWMAQLFAVPGAAIPPTKLANIQAAAVTACDLLDGAQDGLIEDPRKCTFDPSTLLCAAADNDKCLTAAQVDTAKKLYAELRDPKTGEQVYPGYMRGGEGGWGALTTTDVNLALPFFKNIVFEDKAWTFDKFDLARDRAVVTAKVAAAMDTNGTDYSAAKARGVKVIMYHGWSDPQPQPLFTVQLYEKIAAAYGGIDKTKDFMRLFMVPGMAHCTFGSGATSFGGAGQQIPPVRDPAHDVQSAIEAWVEQGIAPNQFIATKYTDDAATTKTVRGTHLLCTYPLVAKYKGTGEVGDAANFQCGVP